MNTFVKRVLFVFAAIGVLSACSKEEKSSGSDSKTIRVTGVTLSVPSADIYEGETLELVATVAPQDASNKKVSWASSNNAVATVQDGLVSAVKAGNATISVTTADGGFKAECAVTVKAKFVPSVTVGSEKISALSAVLKGKANLEEATAPADLKLGFQYSVSADLQNAKTVESSDADAAYNYSAGITGLEPAAKYYFRSFVHKNGQDSYGEIMELTTRALSSLLETKDAGSIEETSAVLNAKLDLTDVQYTNVEYGFYWGTSAESQTTSLEGGTISGNQYSASLTGLTFKTQYWYKAYLTIDGKSFHGEVKSFSTSMTAVQSVSLDKTEHAFDTIGESITLTATVLPENAANKNVEWSSDNTAVATVDNAGKVTAVGNGNANITATTVDQGKTASCAITVAQKVTGISLDRSNATILEGENTVLTATIVPANAVNKSVVWTTSNSGVATVSNGTVTGVSAGNATITATSADGGFTAECAVTVTAYMPVLDATIAEVIAADGGKFRVKGAVIAKADKGIIINDGGDQNLYIFYGNAAIESGVVVGATVSVEGTHSVYGGVVELRDPSSSVIGETITPKAQEPRLIGDYAIDAYKSSHSELIKVIGDYTVEAGAHTLTFSATSKGQLVPGSVTAALSSGTRYAVTGYFVGSNGTTFSILPVNAEVSNERILGNTTIEEYEFDGENYAW